MIRKLSLTCICNRCHTSKAGQSSYAALAGGGIIAPFSLAIFAHAATCESTGREIGTKNRLHDMRRSVHFDARRCKVLLASLPAKGAPRQAISHEKDRLHDMRDRVHFDARRCKVLFACLPAKGVPRQAISHESGVIPGNLPRQRRRRAKPANTGVDAALTSVCLSWPLVSTSRPGRA